MYDSGISASTLIQDLKNEVDIALSIPNKTYIDWLNSLEQLLYTECIKEQNSIEKTNNSSPIDVSTLTVGIDENNIRMEDIYAVYADNLQLIHSTNASGTIFPNTYYKKDNKLYYSTEETPEKVRIIYIVKPKLKSVTTNDTINTGNVMVPIEFIDLVKAKLRGEAYKLCNEFTFAAAWLNDYNVLLETFKAWITSKAPNFGL